jgi:hypothetical protein
MDLHVMIHAYLRVWWVHRCVLVAAVPLLGKIAGAATCALLLPCC